MDSSDKDNDTEDHRHEDDDGNTGNRSGSAGLRNVTALGLVSFFTDFSTEMVLGVLPLFVISTLGASRAILGAIEGSAELAGYAFRMVSGSLSDRTGRRKSFVLAGYAVSAASKPFFAASTGWLDAFIVRTGDRIGKGIRTAPRDALIADSVPESRAGKAFGLHRSIDQMGAVVGPVAAFALLQIVDIRDIFLASLIPGIVALVILVFFVKEVAVKARRKGAATMLGNIQGLVRGNRAFVVLLIVSGIFSLGAFNFSFVLLRSSDLGIQENTIPLVYAVINVSHAAIGIPSGIAADRVGKEKMLIVAFGIFLLSAVLMVYLSGDMLYAYVLAAVFGLYAGISETVQRAVIPRYIPSESRGTAFGLYNIAIGSCLFVGNLMFGFLWDAYGLTVAATYSTTIAVVAISAMLVFIKTISPRFIPHQ